MVTANDGVDVLIEFNGECFDAVVSDQAMPDMSGRQLVEAIEKVAPGKPFYFRSSTGRSSREW